MAIDYLRKILNARVYDVAVETPLDFAETLSARLRNKVLLKREDEQPVFSFKVRGAYNKMAQLDAKQLAAGVIAASAGNHAQGVAMSAQKLGCEATIVMPVTTPQIKVDAVRKRGAAVVLHGDSYSDAYDHALGLAKERGLTLIHPYDDPDIIAGQGTIAVEILRQHPGLIDAIYVAVGGGGMISGVAAYVKRVRPETKVIGVEPVDSDAMTRSLAAGRRIRLSHVGLFADGVAVKQVGRETFRMVREYVDEMILVDTDAISAAIKDVYDDTRSILEPAGALAIAGLKAHVQKNGWEGRTLIAIASGANMNFDKLRFVAERAELGEQREALIAVTIPERPGSFRDFLSRIGHRNITEFNYRYAGPGQAHIFVGIEVSGLSDGAAILEDLHRRGVEAYDLSGNEMAKLHVRHLVGGRAPGVEDEMVYRFEFPERPGALMKFLDSMSAGWNISLFHYRNHGSDSGRVLAGIQVPASEKRGFANFLANLGYDYVEETGNIAYQLFLGR